MRKDRVPFRTGAFLRPAPTRNRRLAECNSTADTSPRFSLLTRTHGDCLRERLHSRLPRGKISSKKDLLPLLEQFTNNGKPLLIIAEDVEGAALATLVVKKLRGSLRVAAVSVPGLSQRKSWLQDIAVLTGGKAIMGGLDTQLKNIQISDLGQAKKVIIEKNRTVIESRARYHQLCSAVPLKSSPGANSSQHGKREYSSIQPTTI
jgi:hypothetical protein